MKKAYSKIFSPNQTLVLRNFRGERRLHFSLFHQFLLAVFVISTTAVFLFLIATTAISLFKPTSHADISASLRDDYEARIDALVRERDNLSEALAASQDKTERLVDNLGEQQDLLFEITRQNFELDNNLSALRDSLTSSQNRLNALDLQLKTQSAQLQAIESGQSLTDSQTLTTITATLSETATARDEARNEVQALRQQIAMQEQQAEIAQQRRKILFDQIEEAIETSLVPMKSTLQKTGLNIDSLLSNIRNSGIGGITSDADLELLAGSQEGAGQVESILDDLDELANLSYLAQSLPLGQPVKSNYRMSSGYGYRRHPISGKSKMHAGQDMAGPRGTPIYATGNGTVIHSGWMSGYGRTVKIQHPNGIQTLYAHMSKVRVNNGQSVKLGDRIGDMGSTGLSTGSHLHYEIHVNGKTINPMNFLRASNYVQ